MSDVTQNTVEHLKMVQGVIERMARNSAQMKTWTVPLVSACLVFSGLSEDPRWLIGASGYVAVIAFWTMDARYIQLERCYIKLREAIVTGESIVPFSLDYRPFSANVGSYWKVAHSWSISSFYVPLFVVVSGLLLFLAT